MDLILAVIIVFLIHIGLLFFIKWCEKNIGVYDTMFCRDVRANLGMFAYRSAVEGKRKNLSNPKSKF